MRFNTLIRWLVVVACLWCVSGCPKETQQSVPQEQTKTAAEYKAEAEKQITSENAEQEMDKLEQSIDAEAAQEQ
ncbi:MAG: hypothetical protein A2Y77_01660 [Planctomycetes bacterium RBG_13_62_9]|nr:MAG: hypothetical protein A2Y77_01660 [Planctomycetes bacterium RBG_13_62_9]